MRGTEILKRYMFSFKTNWFNHLPFIPRTPHRTKTGYLIFWVTCPYCTFPPKQPMESEFPLIPAYLHTEVTHWQPPGCSKPCYGRWRVNMEIRRSKHTVDTVHNHTISAFGSLGFGSAVMWTAGKLGFNISLRYLQTRSPIGLQG